MRLIELVAALMFVPEVGYYASSPMTAPSDLPTIVTIIREELRLMPCTDKCWYLYPGVAQYDTELPPGVSSLCVGSGRRMALVRDVMIDCDKLRAYGKECGKGIRRDGGLYTELHRWVGECLP